MKHPIIASFIGASIALSPVMAEDATPNPPASVVSKSDVIDKLVKDVKASPENAAQLVKNAIINNKADAEFAAQIVKAAFEAAPGQIHNIYNAAIAVAPDTQPAINSMIVAMFQSTMKGDEVADVKTRKNSDGSIEITVDGPDAVVFTDAFIQLYNTITGSGGLNDGLTQAVQQEILKYLAIKGADNVISNMSVTGEGNQTVIVFTVEKQSS